MYYADSQPGQYSSGLASQLMGLGATYVITTEDSVGYPSPGVNSAAIAYGPVTPEPSSLVLAVLGAIGLFLIARRRGRLAACKVCVAGDR